MNEHVNPTTKRAVNEAVACYSCHHGRGRWQGHEYGRNECEECSCSVYVSPQSAHPEDFCDDCGRPNISWFVDSPMWNKLVREPVGYDPMICPACFVIRAEAQGVRATWEIRPEPETLKGWQPSPKTDGTSAREATE